MGSDLVIESAQSGMTIQLCEIQSPWSHVDDGSIPETPFYLYSEARFHELWEAFRSSLGQRSAQIRLHYAMKANDNAQWLHFLKSRGVGIDIVSRGELNRALLCGFQGSDIVFSGVGKSRGEISYALSQNVALLHIESEGEYERIVEEARNLKTRARISFRINPDVDAKTHPYIATGLHDHKFGLPMDAARSLCSRASKCGDVLLEGVSLHIGSQLLDLAPLEEAIAKSIQFCRELKDREQISLKYLDVGGGLGVDYEKPRLAPSFESYGKILQRASIEWQKLQGPEAIILSECGRALVAQAGLLITRVLGFKKTPKKHFAIVDASMTELIRPALYGARHPISCFLARSTSHKTDSFDVVGPVCESSDVFGGNYKLPLIQEGDLLAIEVAGAYGAVMSSHYNGRPRPAQWWISKDSLTCKLSEAAIAPYP